MKGNRWLYGIAALALLAVLAVFIVSAMDTRPTQTQQQAPVKMGVPAATSAEKVKEKSCECCAERRDRLQKKIQEARERRRQREQTATVENSP